jgi:competence protein ComEA
MLLSDEERRALGIILALLLLASGARWIERPRPLLDGVGELDLAALEEASRAAKPPARGPPAAPIDPNRATPRELEQLPGVGPATAARIVEERERAPFASLADLQRRVRGVGPALAGRLAPHVTLPAGGARGPGGAGGAGGGGGPPATAMERLDLNRASPGELEGVPGVGPVLAARLVARRDSLGGFRDWAQVDAVPGVGPAMLARLKELTALRP